MISLHLESIYPGTSLDMQRLIKWLGTRLLPDQADAPAPQVRRRIEVGNPPGKPVTADAPRKQTAESPAGQPPLVEVDTDLVGHIESVGPGKNVLIRHHLLRDQNGAADKLQLVDENGEEPGDSAGFDPYNTGKFDRGEKWRSSIWK